jgi:membrane protease YdiL (CAAX protease family)
VLFLWGIALGTNALRLLVINPWMQKGALQPTDREWIVAPLISLPFLLLPLYLNKTFDHYPAAELGLTWKSRSTNVTIFALTFGAISGVVAFFTGETVVGVSALSIGALLLLVYNNAFLEEFFFRGIIQNRLERVFHQRQAVLISSFVFASTHVLLDFLILGGGGDLLPVLYAFVMQALGGWLLGLVFVKTRTLWPGVACHYLVNWLPSILSLLRGV